MRTFRLYYDKDAEEAWLQSMSAQGWAFKGFFLGVYTFEPCERGEYIYRIDLMPSDREVREDFAAFMGEMGVDVVARWYRWVYLRRKAAEGPFDLYTDAESQIALYSRIRRFFFAAMVLEALCFFAEIKAALETGRALFWLFSGLLLALVLTFLRIILKSGRKIQALRKG